MIQTQPSTQKRHGSPFDLLTDDICVEIIRQLKFRDKLVRLGNAQAHGGLHGASMHIEALSLNDGCACVVCAGSATDVSPL